MNDVLNKEEIEDLLGKDSSPGARSKGLQYYDFSENVSIVKDKYSKLDLVYDKFLRTLKVSLYNFFKKNVDIENDPIKIYKAKDYLSSIPVPTNINIINVPPLKGHGLVCLYSNLVFTIVDKYFGGQGNISDSIEFKNYTPTELRIAQNILMTIFRDLQLAWEDTHPIHFELVDKEIDPNMLTIISPFDLMVVKNFKIMVDGSGGEFHIAIPLSVLEPIKEKLEFNPKTQDRIEDKHWETALRMEILEAPVEVNCILATKRIRLGDVKNLKSGDIIPIDIPEFSQIKIGDIPVYTTKFGTHEGHYAIKIHSKIK